jgi:hypothetical protein
MSALNLKIPISAGRYRGPCLAYWLAQTRLDISITIVERSPSPRVTDQPIGIRDLAVEIIKAMKSESTL